MRLIMSMLCVVCGFIYANGSVYLNHFQDMLSSQTPYTSTLHKDYETDSAIHYKGTIHLSGVLEWQMYNDEVDFYWRLVFFPDVPSALPRLFEGDTREIFLNDTLKRNVELQKNSFLQLHNILQDLSPTDEYILGGIAVRATLTLKDYYIKKDVDSEADSIYYATIEADSIQISHNVRKWYIDKNALPSEYLLYFASEDSYINLRESPNGKILTEIQKKDMSESCPLQQDDKGFLLDLGKDSKNPQWFKVAYIPKEAKDTSKAIYGVIHTSQVSVGCGE